MDAKSSLEGQMIRWKLAIYTKGPFTVSFYICIIHVLYLTEFQLSMTD